MKRLLLRGTLVLCAGLAMLALLAIVGQAKAQVPDCGERDALLSGLKEAYGEAMVWSGVAAGSSVALILTMNLDTGSWTVLGASATEPGIYCFGSVGFGGRLAVVQLGDPS